MSAKRDAIFHSKNKALWYILAFQGGLINVGGFLEVGHFVSHVTGFSGQLVLETMKGRLLSAFFFALIPCAFLLGAFISGYMTEVRRKKHQSPVYIHIMGSMAIIFFALAIAGANNLLPDFGKETLSLSSAFVLALLCGTSGAQNALFTSASGAVVRTTHLTGLFTDFGIGLAKLFGNVDVQHEVRANKLRLGLILFFLLGSLVGAWIFLNFEYLGWLIPASLSTFIAFRLYMTRKAFEAVFPDSL